MADLATATSDVFAQSDGSFVYVGYTAPVNYLSDDGVWEPIDNELVPTAGDTYAVENAENDYTVKLPEDAGSAPLHFASDGRWITIAMDGLDGAPVVDGAEATYADAGADADAASVDVVYEARPEGVKESIILDQPPRAAVEFTFDLGLSAGLVPRPSPTGEIDIIDAHGHQVFTLPAPFMVDAAHALSTNVSYLLDPTTDGWRLTVTPAKGWLDDPARMYPVVVDPTVTLAPTTDGWIAEASPTRVNGGGNYLRVGGDPGSRRRALLKFDVSSIPTDAVISSASLGLYLDSTLTVGGGSTGLVAGRVKSAQTWTPGWLSWNNREYGTAWETPGGSWGDSTPAVTINTEASGYKNISVVAIAQRWINDNWANNGFLVKQSSDADKQLWFKSLNNTTQRPRMVVQYTAPPRNQGGVTVSPGGPGWVSTLTPTLGTTFTDVDNRASDITYSILDAGQVVWTATHTAVPSAQPDTIVVPSGVLQSDQRFVVRVSASNASGTSAFTQSDEIIASPCEVFDTNGLPMCASGDDVPPNVEAEEGAYFTDTPENPLYWDEDPSIDQSSIPQYVWDLAAGVNLPATNELVEKSTSEYSGSSAPDALRGAEWAICRIKTGHPHWSKKGKTVLIKNWVKCKGELDVGNTIPVEVQGYLAVRKPDGFKVAAISVEDRNIPLTWEWSEPFYCPRKGQGHVKANNRWFQGAGLLSITRPDGVSSGAGSSGTPWVQVSGQ